MRPLTSLLATVALLAACSGDSVSAAYGAPPLVDLLVPPEAPESWRLPAGTARIVRAEDQGGLLFMRNTAPTTVAIPLTSGLRGAERIRVHFIADSAFTLGASLAGTRCEAREGADSKRHTNVLELSLEAPLTVEVGDLELTCTASTTPVVVRRIEIFD